MRWALLLTLLATSARAECTELCPLPLISVPPSLGVSWSASSGVMVTSALTLGVRSAHTWLVLADVGVAWLPLTKFEPWLRVSMTRLLRLSELVELGAGGSLLSPDFDVKRLAGGATGVLVLTLRSFSLRVSASVEVPLSLDPVLSLSVAISP